MTLNVALWLVQILLAIKFISVAYTHGLRQHQPTMAEAMQKMGAYSRPSLYLIASWAFIGSIGLILPVASGSLSWITPAAAVILAIMALFSIIFHINYRHRPNIFASVILFVLTAFVAYGRWVMTPL